MFRTFFIACCCGAMLGGAAMNYAGEIIAFIAAHAFHVAQN